jgi:PDZ domain-containing secreted protein
VGGVAEKAVAVEHAGGDLFVVPVDEMTQAEDTSSLPIRGVNTLAQALQVLRAAA